MRARLSARCTPEHVLALLRILCVRASVMMVPVAKASTYVRTSVRTRVRRLAVVRPPVRAYVRTYVVPLAISRAYVRT